MCYNIYMQHIIENTLHYVTVGLGFIGIIIILIGSIDSFIVYLKDRRDFQKVRYIMGKHILLGLDFLVAKDILDTVFLKGSDVHLMDLALLIVIVAIRIALTSHTSKGVEDIREQMELNKIHTKHLDHSIHHLEEDEENFEKQFVELEREELETQRKEILLEKKLGEISQLLKK